jgi:hypothetical protein
MRSPNSKEVNQMSDHQTQWQIERQKQKEWAAQIAVDFPEFKLKDISCGLGWDIPVRALLTMLRGRLDDQNDLNIEWIGQDHGELRMRYELRKGAEDWDGTVENAYDDAQELSWAICELTGEPGAMVARGGEGRIVRALRLLRVGDRVVDPGTP